MLIQTPLEIVECADGLFYSAKVTKYCDEDGKTVLDLEDDAAHVNLGGKWRMPTFEELKELIWECDWIWITQNGVSGRRVYGPSGNSIFLPGADSRWESDSPPPSQAMSYTVTTGLPLSKRAILSARGNYGLNQTITSPTG